MTWIGDLKYAPIREEDLEATNPYLGDTPLYAAIKALYYSIVANRNRAKLQKYKMFHSNSRALEQGGRRLFLENAYSAISVIVPANTAYWFRWQSDLQDHHIDRQISALAAAFSECLAASDTQGELNCGIKRLLFVDYGDPQVTIEVSLRRPPPSSLGLVSLA